MRYIKNHMITLLIFENKLVITAVDSNPIEVEEGKNEITNLLKIFCDPKTYEQAYEEINKKIYITEKHYKEIFEFLRVNNILKEYHQIDASLTKYEYEKYDRQIKSFASLTGYEYPQAVEIQKKISNFKVAIIGVGGTGSHLSLALASIGVNNMILVDFDKIELSNTSRQILYDENDIGKLKINVACDKLKRYNSNLEIKTFNKNIKSIEDLSFLDEISDINLLILTADTPRGEIQYIIDEKCKELNIPWLLYGPFEHSKVFIGPYIIPNKTKTFSEIFNKNLINNDSEVNAINDSFIPCVCDPYNAFASQFAAIEILKIITQTKESSLINKRFYIDTNDWTVDIVNYE